MYLKHENIDMDSGYNVSPDKMNTGYYVSSDNTNPGYYVSPDNMNPGYYVSSDESDPESIPDDWEPDSKGNDFRFLPKPRCIMNQDASLFSPCFGCNLFYQIPNNTLDGS